MVTEVIEPPTGRDIHLLIPDSARQLAVDAHVYAPATPGVYGVIVFSHGGNGANDNLPILDYWASLGFIVIAPEHIDSKDREGLAAVNQPATYLDRVADMRLMLDSLALIEEALGPGYAADTGYVVAAGHSEGAFIASLLTGLQTPVVPDQTDPRFSAGLLLSPQGVGSRGETIDSWDRQETPTLFITGTLDYIPGGDGGRLGEERLDGFFYGPTGGKHAVTIEAGTHLSYVGNAGQMYLPQYQATQEITRLFLQAYAQNDPDALGTIVDAAGYDAERPLVHAAYAKPGLDVTGGPEADTLAGTNGPDSLAGSAGGDLLDGRGSNDELRGGAGNDTLDGGEGRDLLEGGDGDDILFGGADADRLVGGAGRDQMWGGAGADVFIYTDRADSPQGGRDRIMDFRAAEGDMIDLSGLGVTSFVGDSPFTGPGQVRAIASDGGVVLEVNLDAQLGPEMKIELAGANIGEVTAATFVFWEDSLF